MIKYMLDIPPLLSLLLLLILYPSFASLQICPPDYFFNNQHCQACSPNCECRVQGTCDNCIPGYTLYNNTCLQCPQSNGIYGSCSSCCASNSSTILSCTDCQPVVGFFSFLYSGRCILSPGCFQIDAHGFCTQCLDHYYQSNNLCHSCDGSCASCSDPSNCLTCASGYYWGVGDGGLCRPCSAGCSTCTATQCTACLPTYFFTSNICQSCPQHCTYCTDASTCYTCSLGILISNLCLQCTDPTYGGSPGCTTCLSSNNFIVCTLCDDLYYLDANGGCTLCATTIPGAARCTDPNTPTQCLNDHAPDLPSRYYLIGINCILNANHCKLMADAAGTCLNCYPTYLLTNNVCILCNPPNCALPLITNSTCTCSSCAPTYYLASNACTPCTAPHCAVCNANTCTACLTGYYWSGTTCTTATTPSCTTALTATTCALCTDAYYKGTDNLCYQCQDHCQQCTTNHLCNQCSAGTVLIDGRCVTTPNNCFEVKADATCNVCMHGYYLQNGFCLACTIELNTLHMCKGLCPIDYYIQSLLTVDNWETVVTIGVGLAFVFA